MKRDNGRLILYKEGDIIGECTFIRYPYDDITTCGRRAIFLCKCGKEFEAKLGNVRSKTTRSCGCLQIASQNRVKTTHGKYHHPYYGVWNAMMQRCGNPKFKAFKNWGGRGIIVCERWRDPIIGFANFLSDMGDKPTPKHQLDRIDNDGNYEPSNCRWATRREQCGNRRDSVKITFNDKTQHLSEWARELNISFAALRYRINIMKLPLHLALTSKKYKNG